MRGDNEEADQRASIERRTWLIKAVHRAKEAGVAMDGQRQCIYLCWWWFTCRVLWASQQTDRVEVWRSIRVPHNTITSTDPPLLTKHQATGGYGRQKILCQR